MKSKESLKKSLKIVLFTSSFGMSLGFSIIGSRIIGNLLNMIWGILFFTLFATYSIIYLVKYKGTEDIKKIADATLAIFIEEVVVIGLSIASVFGLKYLNLFINNQIIVWGLFIVAQLIIFGLMPADDYQMFKKLNFKELVQSEKKNTL